MEDRLTDLSYEDWVEHVFSHEVCKHGIAWYFDLDAPWWDGPPAVTLDYVTRLFEAPEAALEYFADSQIAQGIYYLVDSGAGDLLRPLGDPRLPLEDRLRCVAAIHTFFARIFQPRCTPHLSRLDEAGTGPLNGICYMWWDIFPAAGTPDAVDGQAINQAILGVMVQGLGLDSIACQESALHGLGHWQPYHEDAVAAIVDRFRAGHPDLRPELSAYAQAARCGCVL